MRTISPEDFNTIKNEVMIIDVRREDDYEKSAETLPGAVWKNPSLIDEWIETVPKDGKVVFFCVRGGGVSNSVLDRLQAEGINASYIEGVKSGGDIIAK